MSSNVEYSPLSTNTDLKRRRGWVIGISAMLIALGVAAIVFPFFASLAVEQLVGWVLFLSGVLGVLHALADAKAHGFMLRLLGAVLSVGVGVVLVLYPFSGVLSLTLLVAAFFVAGGLLRIVLAMQMRRVSRHGLTLTSGILGVALGVSIVVLWPEAAAWIIGILIGIDLIFAGIASLALAARL